MKTRLSPDLEEAHRALSSAGLSFLDLMMEDPGLSPRQTARDPIRSKYGPPWSVLLWARRWTRWQLSSMRL
jgi:hypothetical protein